ncbi:Kelch-like protein 17 [Zootermopsis nevadensis]|uniref:Kelch-like protein 17 n=1 Tax=Zootermopsis nevadensis TaxID=136037 RepID=A0A067QV83_ZOONE|nr:Kelch-like protein 17 [Zootermopsis nevadensis]
MLSERRSLSCVAFHGFLYALGGLNETSSLLSTEKYDPTEDTWTEIPGMNVYSDYLNAEVFDDTIFVISRYFDKGHSESRVACFDDKENRWFVSFFIVQDCTITNCYFRKALGSESFPVKVTAILRMLRRVVT